MAYLPLSTASLPDPVIDPAQGASPADHFGVNLWSGNSSSSTGDSTVGQVITTGMQPDWIWTKERNNTGGHKLFDTVRGLTKQLSSNSTAAEETRNGDDIVSVSSTGFTIGTNTGINYNGRTYVGWSWKANGSGVSNTDGSITSTVSANTTSGFSVCTFSSTGSDATVGHGLSSAPDWIVFMRRNTAGSDHLVYHSALGATKNMRLNNTDAVRTQDHFLNTEPTSSVFSIKGTVFTADKDYVAYCFSGVDSFSKFGSYVGNGSADGPFVYTGFRPAFVMIKRTNSAASWYMTDDARYDTNRGYGSAAYLYADTSAAEMTTENIDMLSNGFKLRRDSGLFNYPSGDTFIYMAFAENPFKYSNAR